MCGLKLFGAFVLFAVVLSVNADPVPMVDSDNEIETMSIIDDLLELLKKYLKTAEDCVAEARDNCKSASSQNPILGVRCIVQYIISQSGTCKLGIFQNLDLKV